MGYGRQRWAVQGCYTEMSRQSTVVSRGSRKIPIRIHGALALELGCKALSILIITVLLIYVVLFVVCCTVIILREYLAILA